MPKLGNKGSTKYLYRNGLPFSDKLAQNLDELINRVNNNKASMLIIDGGVGEGKTTLNTECGDYVNAQYGKPPIDLTDPKCPQIATGGSQFIKKMRKCFEKKLPYILYSEAGDFSKRGALTKFNGLLNSVFETYRAFKVIVGLDLPSFNSLDPSIMEKQIPRLLINCHDRVSPGGVHKLGWGNFRGYSLYRMYYIKENMRKQVVKPLAYTRVEPNFRGHFKDLTNERRKSLDRISTTAKIDKLKKSEVEIDGLMNYNQLAIRLMRSVVWVRTVVNSLGIKAEKELDRVKYFNEDVVSQLGEFLGQENKVEKLQEARELKRLKEKEKSGLSKKEEATQK